MSTLLMSVFNARYGGTCGLSTCERRGVIEQGDVCQYVDDVIHHMVCARRVARGETEHLCPDCYTYHAGECE